MAFRRPELKPIRACLFDMDGLLIDSEDLYTLCTNEVLREFNRPELPWNIKAQLQGRPGPEAGRIFQEWAQLPISQEEYNAKVRTLQAKYFPTCRALPGVEALLLHLSKLDSPKIHLALATSSHKNNFLLKTGHLPQMFSVFPAASQILGDDPRIARGRGKPAPDIYLLALKTINDCIYQSGDESPVQPNECLVFEDSVPGVEAGRRAGMQVVWCPHPGLLNEYRWRIKEVLAGGTGELKEEKESAHVSKLENGVPGDIDDGWGAFLPTLENFPYEKYGIGR